MPTVDEIKTAQSIMKEALTEAGLELGGNTIVKRANNNANLGLRPLLAFAVAVIRRTREFKHV